VILNDVLAGAANESDAGVAAHDVDPCDTVDAWRDGELLVIGRGAALPRRCIVTNEPIAGFLTTRLYWHGPAWYAALVLVPGVYMIYLFMFASSIETTCGLSRRMLDRRRYTNIGASFVFAAGLLIAASGDSSNAIRVAAGYALMLAGVAWWAIGTRLLRVTRVESEYAWVKGAHPDYLMCLPPWTGSPDRRVERKAASALD